MRLASQGFYQFHISDAQRYAASAMERDLTTREITHNTSNNYKKFVNEQTVQTIMLACAHVPIKFNYNDAHISNVC